MSMTHPMRNSLLAVVALAAGMLAADSTTPIAGPDLVFAEVDGLVAVEAEHFYRQTLADKRAWHITSAKNTPDLKPDADPPHVAGASGGAYLEILPDTRRTAKDKLVDGENFSGKPGLMAVLHYRVHVSTPGRYYVWVRTYSTGPEDNGVHVGLNGQWPASGQRWQTVQKQKWAWDCRQRTQQVHTGVPMQLFLDIDKAGEHEVLFSLREDGFEMDKFILASSKEFRPVGKGPAANVKAGRIPAPFPEVAESAPAPARFPAHWGEPPAIQTRDLRPLPGGYGEGSSTLAGWIQQNLDRDAAAGTGALAMTARDFIGGAKGYYLDREKWLAIHPEKNKEASAQAAFPFPAGTYHVVLHVVGESDGQSTFQVVVNDTMLGDFTAPPSTEMFEEGPRFSTTWRDTVIPAGARIGVSSRIASADGQEWSRARVARVEFAPADDATKAATAAFAAAAKPAVPALVQPRQPDGAGTVAIGGELAEWHKVTLTLDGPFAHERDTHPNAFTDLAFSVQFTHESGSPRYTVPGYFAADGNAANSSAESGVKWRAHLTPDKTGRWDYVVSFRRGADSALQGGGVPVAPFHGLRGSFAVVPSDKKGRDFRAHGRLHYVGGHHLQFAGSKQYFLKAGPDAPETLLAYADFDGTTTRKPGKGPLKTWAPHVGDWRPGDPTWGDGKGKGLVGALNYLAGKGVNAFSFLTYNAAGDGDNVWPFVERDAKLHYDCSKLDQWGLVFDHATAHGLYLHFKLQENEMDDNRLGAGRREGSVPESLDGGKLGRERKLYCREIVARFGHALAMNWNIGEENTQSSDEIRDMARFLRDTDPYQHPIVLHTFPPQQDAVYRPLLGDQSALTGVSLQNPWDKVHQRTLQWLRESAASGHPWVVANDEQNPASLGVPPDPGYQGHDGIAAERPREGTVVKGNATPKSYTLHDIRKRTLWGNLMAGGAGVEYYFGYSLPENDLLAQDFRSRDASWDYCRIALEFFRAEKIPFWEMTSANALVGNEKDDNSRYCFAKPGEIYLVYLPDGGSSQLDLARAEGAYTLHWFNPRQGGPVLPGRDTIPGGGQVNLTAPDANDWLAVLRRQ